jgi:hypothetical protein
LLDDEFSLLTFEFKLLDDALELTLLLLLELLLLLLEVLSLLVDGSLIVDAFESALLSADDVFVGFILPNELLLFPLAGSFVAVEPLLPLSFISRLPLFSIFDAAADELFITALPFVGVEGDLPVEEPLLLLSLFVIILPEPPLNPPIEPRCP